MNNGRGRERAIWIGVVAVLATSLLWLAAFFAIAVAGTHAVAVPGAIVVIKSLALVVKLLAARAWPVLLFALGGIMLALILSGSQQTKQEARHA